MEKLFTSKELQKQQQQQQQHKDTRDKKYEKYNKNIRNSDNMDEKGIENKGITIDLDNLSDSGYERAEELSHSEITKMPRLPGDGAQMDDEDFKNVENFSNLSPAISKPNKSKIQRLQSVRIIDGDTRENLNINSPSQSDCESVQQRSVREPFNNEIYSAFKKANVIKGILCPSMTNSFKNRSLERSYLTYTHRQRQKSLIMVNIVDLLLKAVLALVWFIKKNPASPILDNPITWSTCCIIANLAICLLGIWRCFANNYLHWAATCTWLLFNLQGFIGQSLGFADREYLVWYILFIIFVPYAMLPLPLRWCVIAGTVSAFSHLIIITIMKFKKEKNDTTCIVYQILANFLLYSAINVAGMYTKYLTDRSQRLAFIETHKAMEHKKESENELLKTQKLLDSIIPMVINNKIRNEMCKNNDTNVESQFKKLYVYHMENVSILFADIVGFTELASKTLAEPLVKILNDLFARFDRIAEDNYCLRIKLLGDCYYCVSMFENQNTILKVMRPDHAVCSVETGLHMIKAIKDVQSITHVPLDMRIGIHSGSVMCGVLGNKKWHFDVWSNDVIIANHMESGGLPGRVHISESTKNCLNDAYEIEPGNGGDRDNHLKMLNVNTYLIKRTEPLRQCRRFINRNKESNPIKMVINHQNNHNTNVEKKTVINVQHNDPNLKSKNKNSIHDDEPTTDWTPEIPFKNLNEPEDGLNRTESSVGDKQNHRITMSATEEIDDFIDQNIQINSNKAIRQEYLYGWTLKFKDASQEQKFCELREDMFRSNMLCVFVVWIFIVLCQAIIIPKCVILLICLALGTILFGIACILVMAEEFTGLPIILQRSSASLVLRRNSRTVFICTVIFLMSLASSVGLILCEIKPIELNHKLNEILSSGSNSVVKINENNNNNNKEFKLNVYVSATIHHNITINTPGHLNQLTNINLNDSNFYITNDSSNFIDSFNNNTGNSIDVAASALLSAAVNLMPENVDDYLKKTIENALNLTNLNGPINNNNNNNNNNQINFDEYEQSEIVHNFSNIQNKMVDNNNLIKSIEETNQFCAHPEYIVFTWILCLIALATALKLYYLIKTLMAIIMVACYSTLILFVFPKVFNNDANEYYETSKIVGMPLTVQMLILLVVFLIMVTYHARLVEVTSRLDFIWKEQAEKELTNMKSNRFLNDVLIKNILPDHVATYYLSHEGNDELYAKMHKSCGVMFASIPNFKDFYSEDIENGKECIRILNEIICDFDAILEESCFLSIEKIKTVGATYMAASGLNCQHLTERGETSEDSICDLVEFALAMKQTLQEFNKSAFNTFQLRVGISSGPLVSGVIGARKPVYDIWGNTVNVASRMDTTGESWRIQVPTLTAYLLQEKGYTCVERDDEVNVKGKGKMKTYFVLGKGVSSNELIKPILIPAGMPTTPQIGISLQRQTSQHGSFSAVVFEMMQASKRNSNLPGTPIGTPSPQIRRGRRGSTFSSVRLSSQKILSNPVRRNTTRVRGRSYHQKKSLSNTSIITSQMPASNNFLPTFRKIEQNENNQNSDL